MIVCERGWERKREGIVSEGKSVSSVARIGGLPMTNKLQRYHSEVSHGRLPSLWLASCPFNPSPPGLISTYSSLIHPPQTMSNPTSTNEGASPAPQNQQPSAQPEAGPSEPRHVNGQTNGTDGDVTMNGEQAPSPDKAEEQAPDLSSIFAARREEEMERKDRSLAEFLVMLDNYKPLVRRPDQEGMRA